MKLLVAYASPHGSTAEVATFIGRTLKAYDVEVVVKHATEIRDSIDEYDAVILGSAVHASMWLPSITRLMFRFEEQLAQKPIHMFLMCIIAMEEGGRKKALEDYVWDEALQRLNITRDNIGVFAGKLDWEHISGDERWLLSARYEGKALPNRDENDFRDWQRIAAWTHQVAHELELPLDLSETHQIEKVIVPETITAEEVENLEWVDNPGEIEAF